MSKRIARRTLLTGSLYGSTLFLLSGTPAAWAQSDFLKKGLDALGGAFGGDNGSGGLSEVQIGKGLREALEVASVRVIDLVGQVGGYFDDQAIHIPLPGYLADVQDILRKVGASGMVDDIELRLNRAAEMAAPHAKSIFFDAIDAMTIDDARKILDGPDDAATRYFERRMTPSLKQTFHPIVKNELEQAGAIASLERTVKTYDSVPFAPALAEDSKEKLIDHGLDGALSGIFHYLAKEESAIRNNPAKRTTELLQQVFG